MLMLKEVAALAGEKPILRGVNLEIGRGEIHVIMGPNGTGKSTLAHVILGAKTYTLTGGSILLDDEEISSLSTDARAKKGLFLAFQYPVAIPGLRISEYLRNLYSLRHGIQPGVAEFRKILKDKLAMLNIERTTLQRYLNDGFSGGEMKRLEMLQLLLLEPKVAILDEIDSGVDVDAQKVVAACIRHMVENVGTSFLLITHYQRLLNFIQPHKIHVMLEGRIARSGDMSLVEALEREGYEWVRRQEPTINR